MYRAIGRLRTSESDRVAAPLEAYTIVRFRDSISAHVTVYSIDVSWHSSTAAIMHRTLPHEFDIMIQFRI